MCTYYVRDLSGNIISIYTGTETTALQKEMAVYGSGRLGTAAVDAQGEFIESYLYELTDHLGNVRATLKDNYNGNGILNSYADYYPGGMPMPGGDRTKVASSAYKFGYQGQFAEKDQETDFNQFEARLYDARIMRWNVPDPAGQFWSPYNGMGNDWINGVDMDGLWSSPIYSFTGNYLGDDEEGFFGEIIFMTRRNFMLAGGEGMSHDNAVYYGELFSEIPEGFLSLKTYANVWNHIISRVEGVDLSMLPNGSVSIFTGRRQLSDIWGTMVNEGYNNPTNASGILASVPYGENRITVNHKMKHLLGTVENVQNGLGEHEFYGHIILKFNDRNKMHHLVYARQFKRPSWLDTTQDFKDIMNDNYNDLLGGRYYNINK